MLPLPLSRTPLPTSNPQDTRTSILNPSSMVTLDSSSKVTLDPSSTVTLDSSSKVTLDPSFTVTIGLVPSSTITQGPQDTGAPITNPLPLPAPTLSLSSTRNGANPRIIAPVCIAILTLLLSAGVLYFRVTRKRWPFTGYQHQTVILEPYPIERTIRVVATENHLSTRGTGSGDSSGELDKNAQRGYPLVAQRPISTPEAPVPREQHLENQFEALMREVENIKAQLLTVGAQSTQRVDQPQDDGPPDYSSQSGSAEVRPPGVTRENPRDSS